MNSNGKEPLRKRASLIDHPSQPHVGDLPTQSLPREPFPQCQHAPNKSHIVRTSDDPVFKDKAPLTFSSSHSRKTVSFLFRVVILLALSLSIFLIKNQTHYQGNAAGTLTFPPNQVGLRALTVQSLPMPGYLQTVTDPTMGNQEQIMRVSDQTAFGTTNLLLTHDYALIQPWNADGSMLLLSGWYFNTDYLLNGNTGAYLRTVHDPDGESTARWSNVNPNNMYGIPPGGGCNNGNQLAVWHPETDTSSNPTLTILHTFSQYDTCGNMNFGDDKGNLSNDDTFGVVEGWSSTRNSWGMTTFSMSNVNTATPTVTEIATYWFGAAGGTTNNPSSENARVSAMPKGDGVHVLWSSTGPGLTQGIEWFNPTLTTALHVTDSSSHHDVGLDASGNEMIVTACSQPGGSSTNTCTGVSQTNGSPFIAGYIINGSGPTGTNVNLYPSPASTTTFTSSVHVSCRNQFQRPGWCYVSDYMNNPSAAVGYEQIYALKLDGSQTAEVFGVDHGSYNSCQTCNQYTARAVPYRDGSKVIFDSDWGAGTSAPSYDYIISWPQGVATPTPTNTPTPTPTLGVVDTKPPTVTIISPLNGNTVHRHSYVTITSTASDDVGVTQVSYSINGSQLCTKTTSPYTCFWSVPGKPNAAYTITATAYDAAGYTGTNAVRVTAN